jgi:hypothetical protein
VTKGITEQQAWEKWFEIAPLIDRMMERVGTRDEFPVMPHSALAGDDAASSPYQVSHAFKQCLATGVDHLHAARVLVLGPPQRPHEQPILHMSAHAALARGALENFAVAYWLLHPKSRNERIERALRWHVKNVNDQHEASTDMNTTPPRTKQEMLQDLEAVIKRRTGRIPSDFRRGYTSTGAVKAAQQVLPRPGLGVLTPWRVCSGFAHGRPWVSLGLLEREEFRTADDGTLHLRLTSDGTRSLIGPLAAIHLLQDVLKLYASRAGAA